MRDRAVRNALAFTVAGCLAGAALGVACSSSSSKPEISSSSFAKDATSSVDTGVTSPSSDAAVDAGHVEPSTKIAAGALHVCAIIGGSVECWGSNGNGEIGLPSDSNAYPPTKISGVAFTPTMIDGTAFHDCVSDGTQTACWGLDSDEEIGTVSTDSVCPLDVCPTTSVALGSITGLALGDGYTCFLASGTVGCFGYDYYGALGVTSDGGFSTTPLPIQPLTGITQVSSGDAFLCALKSDGSVWCWGQNSNGELGQGNGGPDSGFDQNPNPAPVQVPGIDAIQVSAGTAGACAVLIDHTVSCWGYGGTQNYTIDGQLGHDPASDPHCDGYPCDPKPTPVTGLTNVREVAVGFHQTCAVMLDDTVECFGDDTYGQLLTASTLDGGPGAPWNFSPQVMPGLTNVAHVSSGYNFVCAVTWDNHVLCWGDDAYGELGVPVPTSGPKFLTTPVTPIGL